jgi:hypothetical protein
MTELPEAQPGRLVLADVVRNAIVDVCGPMGMIKDVTEAVQMCNGVKNGLLWTCIQRSLDGRIKRSIVTQHLGLSVVFAG